VSSIQQDFARALTQINGKLEEIQFHVGSLSRRVDVLTRTQFQLKERVEELEKQRQTQVAAEALNALRDSPANLERDP